MNDQNSQVPIQDENQNDPLVHSDQNNLADFEVDLQKAKDEAAKNLDGWRRSQAEFENYQKRKEGENKELIEFAREVTIAKLLPTIDTVEQSLAHIPDDISKMDEWKNGISGTLKKLEGVLHELGVKKIVAVGQKFNPNFHEAVREVSGDEDGIVVEEYQTGYELNGKVIRPSQVVISKKQ